MKTVYLETVESTNSYCKEHLAELSDGTVMHAANQTSGRGRFSRKWIDLGRGNLFMSFVLKPHAKFRENYSNLTQYLSVVLCKVLDEYGVNPEIKWPNDVLVNGAKIAGILAETVVQGKKFRGIILGIGVNLNTEPQRLSSVKDKIITALNIEIGESIDLDAFRSRLTGKFFEHYEDFLEGGFSYIKNEYIKRACFLNREISVKVFDEEKRGFAEAVNDKGELILKNNEREFVLTIGDIL